MQCSVQDVLAVTTRFLLTCAAILHAEIATVIQRTSILLRRSKATFCLGKS